MVFSANFGVSCTYFVINKLLSYFRFSFLIVMISMVTACSGGGGDDTDNSATYYQDADSDGYGDPASPRVATSQPAGYVPDNTDCDDSAAAVHPGATEINDGLDNNCNGQVDDVHITYYQDADSDSYGNPAITQLAISQPTGYVLDNTDCNDSSAAAYPGATEIGDGIDNNCNGQIDEGFITYYQDGDSDGYGDLANTLLTNAQPAGYVLDNTDCDDSAAAVNPGAVEVNDGIDNNCDGQIDFDSDNDGVSDVMDTCPGTASGSAVDANGCALSQLDSDNDGVSDAIDLCPGTAAGETVDSNGCALAPPVDPATVAPATEIGVATNMHTSTEFLYTGATPIQSGVSPGTINPVRVAVLRGKVRDRSGNPISGVAMTVLNHPEYGQTMTRDDGMFDLAVNGGGNLTLTYKKHDYLPVQRQAKIPWQDYVVLPEVVMITLDPKVTAVTMNNPAIQLAEATPVTDVDGTRQSVVLIPAGTTANMEMPDGTMVPMATLNIRSTEFTVGEDGLAAMPGPLPPSSAYTYAVDLQADEATAAGAVSVIFNQPVYNYVDNFLEFPAGTAVPNGFYDERKGAWIGAKNGIVIAVVGETAGLVDIDVDGDGVADTGISLTDLNITDTERQMLASQYSQGQSLWRVPIPHFSPWDHNFPYSPPPDATIPPSKKIEPRTKKDKDPCNQPGSIIGCQNQTLSESVGIVGTNMSLHYTSGRAPASKATTLLKIPLSESFIPSSLKRIDLNVNVAGQSFNQSFVPETNLQHSFQWNGKNAYGQTVQGSASVTGRVSYVYSGVYTEPADFQSSWARFSDSGLSISATRATTDINLSRDFGVDITNLNYRKQGIAGWSLNNHHFYDTSGQTLYLGNGTTVNNSAIELNKFKYHGPNRPAINSVRSMNNNSNALVMDDKGALYIGSLYEIWRLEPDGVTLKHIAGTGVQGFSGDGGAATAATFDAIRDIDLGPDGSLYIADSGNQRIRRIWPDGIIDTVAGRAGDDQFGNLPKNDENLATNASISRAVAVEVAPDGGFYIADYGHQAIRYVAPDGIISTYAGVRAWALALNESTGNLYYIDALNNRIFSITPSGQQTIVAGGGPAVNSGDDWGNGGLATEAYLGSASKIDVDGFGSLLIASNNYALSVGTDGIIRSIAGTGFGATFDSDAGLDGPAPAANTRLVDISIGPDGKYYLLTRLNSGVRPYRIRVLSSVFSGYDNAEKFIASEDGAEVFRFDHQGRHLETLDSVTGNVLFGFSYNAEGRLQQVADVYGNITTLEYTNDLPSAIVAYGGQRTTLTTNADGYLDAVVNPAGESTAFTYAGQGLLSSMIEPNGASHQYFYDADGLLIRDVDPLGNAKTLSRVETENGSTVTYSTAMGRSTVYASEELPTGDFRTTITYPGGSQLVTTNHTDGTSTANYPDGRMMTMKHDPDPRFGMQSPYLSHLTVINPSGLTQTMAQSKTVTLLDPANLLSFGTMETSTIVNGRESMSVYDSASKTSTKILPSGREFGSVIDVFGRVTETQVTIGLDPIIATYNNIGLRTEYTQGLQSMFYDYDALNRLTTTTNANGDSVSLAYDNADRLLQVTRPEGLLTKYGYDLNGLRTSVVMPEGQSHGLSYTDRRQQSGYITPDNNVFARGYNPDSQLLTRTLPSGRAINNTFDVNAYWTGVDYPEYSIEFAFVGKTERIASVSSRRTSGPEDAQLLEYTYDGQLPLSTTFSGMADGSFSYTYNTDFFVTEVALNSGTDIVVRSVGFDVDGQPVSWGPFTQQRNGPGGSVSAITDTTMDLIYDYDTMGRAYNRLMTVNNNSLYALDLTYSGIGQISSKSETIANTNHVYTYEYDGAGRLLNVLRDGVSIEQYTYDGNGNTLTLSGASALYDNQDRIVSLDGTAYVFDDDGYLTQRGTDIFVYSTRGELLSATPDGSDSIRYAHDGYGRRVARTDASGTVQYLYGNPANLFLITAIRNVDGVLTVYDYDEKGLLFAMERAGVRYYIATDQVGSPRVISDVNGDIVKTIDYSTYGVRLSDSAPAFDIPFGYAGGLEDLATGLVRFGYRDYDQASGRWTARDPALYAGGQANLYAYVGNDPINHRDPLGLWCVSASLYIGFGAGGETCCKNGTCSYCGEAGLGLTGGAGVNNGGAKESGADVSATYEVGCGPVTADNGCGYSPKCGWTCKTPSLKTPIANVDLGTGEVTNNLSPFSVSPASSSNGKCGLTGKIALRNCEQFQSMVGNAN